MIQRIEHIAVLTDEEIADRIAFHEWAMPRLRFELIDWQEAIEADWKTLYPDPVERMVVREALAPMAEELLLYGTDGKPSEQP